MDVIDVSYFENKYFKIIIQMIKEYHQKWDYTPNFETLEQLTKSEISQELAAKIVLDTINKIKTAPESGSEFVQEKALTEQVKKKIIPKKQSEKSVPDAKIEPVSSKQVSPQTSPSSEAPSDPVADKSDKEQNKDKKNKSKDSESEKDDA